MNKKSPMRMCVGCHEMREKREMIRVLKMQDNTFCIDAAGRKTAAEHICAKRWSVWIRQSRITDWNVRSK